ncbi:MFS transporter [Acetobacter aceti]|uniref:hypothetical protein n=1 Tax=Acetobacter aceti TaxID=435 RepID=UPI001E32C22A|nr:hypothetical protein [Acetobacter aceti]
MSVICPSNLTRTYQPPRISLQPLMIHKARLFRRFGFRAVMMTMGWGGALTFGAIACFQPAWPLWTLTLVLLASGAVQAIQFSAYNSIAYADLPEERMSNATSFYSTFQQMMLSAGICVAALAVTVWRTVQDHPQAVAADFRVGFLVVGALTCIAVPVAARLRPDAVANVSGSRFG